MNKKKKIRVLVTAGATWVKVDEVRILTNRFTGKTGLSLAEGLKKKGYRVTLLANPHCLNGIKDIKLISYRYFELCRCFQIDHFLLECRRFVLLFSGSFLFQF